jgi:hypothetical protein
MISRASPSSLTLPHSPLTFLLEIRTGVLLDFIHASNTSDVGLDVNKYHWIMLNLLNAKQSISEEIMGTNGQPVSLKGRIQLSCDPKDIVMGYKAQICRRVDHSETCGGCDVGPNTIATSDLLVSTLPLTTT